MAIIEEVAAYLTLSDRKNLRLTCKRLYELCNSDHFCRNEKIKWSENWIHLVNTQSDLCRIGRQIRSLDVEHCRFQPGSLESIIMLCKGLCSLSLKSSVISSDSSILELFSVTHPNVAFLELTLPYCQPHFHSVFSIFPNVKKLRVQAHYRDFPYKPGEWSSIFDDIMRSCSNLECLELKIPLNQSIIKKSEFFEALPLSKKKGHLIARYLKCLDYGKIKHHRVLVEIIEIPAAFKKGSITMSQYEAPLLPPIVRDINKEMSNTPHKSEAEANWPDHAQKPNIPDGHRCIGFTYLRTEGYSVRHLLVYVSAYSTAFQANLQSKNAII
ncbi:hypothetical protein ACFE04_021567 [Oxalis oulophora]